VRTAVRPNPWLRLLAELVDAALQVVTLCVGWLLWFVFVARRGQSPAKAMLGLRIHDSRTGEIASTGRVWLREAGWKLAFPGMASAGVALFTGDGLASALLGIYYLAGALSVLTDAEQRAIWDHLSSTELRKRGSVTPDDADGGVWLPALDDIVPSRRTPIR
jgi:uncharacterized RDD family membrane protein YckC